MALPNTQTAPRFKVKSSLENFDIQFDSRPIPIDGTVNVDNISDREYDIIQEIANATFEGKIRWKALGLVAIFSTFLLENKMPDLQYSANYNGYRLLVKTTARGKITITVKTRFSNKTIVETFIPYKPTNENGDKVGTSRAILVYHFFKAIRYKVDGYLMAS